MLLLQRQRALVPYPTAKMLDGTMRPLGNITYNDSIGMSNYNALWVTYRRSLRGGLAFNTTYTYSKSMDQNSQSGNSVQDNTNPAGSYGLSDFDVRHHFVFSGTWTLPFHGNRLKDGWLIADVTQIQGGNPLNVVTGSAYSGATGNIRPTLLAQPSVGVHKALANFNIPYHCWHILPDRDAGLQLPYADDRLWQHAAQWADRSRLL